MFFQVKTETDNFNTALPIQVVMNTELSSSNRRFNVTWLFGPAGRAGHFPKLTPFRDTLCRGQSTHSTQRALEKFKLLISNSCILSVKNTGIFIALLIFGNDLFCESFFLIKRTYASSILKRLAKFITFKSVQYNLWKINLNWMNVYKTNK